MAHWRAHHRKIAIFGWLAFCLGAFVIGTMVIGTNTLQVADAGVRESGRMDRLVDKEFKTPAGERVIVQSATLTTLDPGFQAVIGDVIKRLKANQTITNFKSPLDDPGLVSADRHSVLIDFEMTGDPDTAEDRVQPILDTTAAAQRRTPTSRSRSSAPQVPTKSSAACSRTTSRKRGSSRFRSRSGSCSWRSGRSLRGHSIAAGADCSDRDDGTAAIPSKVLPMDESIGAVVLLIGLAVGVDYTMFYLKREREERAEGKSEEEALEIAAATSGRSVLISGLTVMIAMAGMFLTGDPTFKGFGAATILVVAVAVLGSLTVLPAMLSWLGDRVERLHIPVPKSMRPKHGESRFWSAILGPVLRHPIPAVLLAGGFLVALCLVALQLKTVTPGADTYPQSLPAVKTYNKMQQAFPGVRIPPES